MRRYFLFILLFLGIFLGCDKNQQKPCCEEIPLHAQMGAEPKMYSVFTVTPETQDAMSVDFTERWNKAKTEIEQIAGGPRRLRSFEIKFISDNELNLTYTYNTATGGTARAILGYNYTLDSRGYMHLTFIRRDANGRLISPALFSFQEDYFERYPFRLEWIENIIPGSTGKMAAYYKDGDPNSYIYGTISK